MIVNSTILTDKDVVELADMASAIEAVTRAFEARASGALIAPPRHSVTFPDLGALTFTIGGVAGDAALAGFRVYDTFDTHGAPHTQIVAVWNARDGSLQGVILGERLGDLRIGAIGGLAIRHMARADSKILGMIGSGAQARTQVAAAATVRLHKVRVYSRDTENRAPLPRRWRNGSISTHSCRIGEGGGRWRGHRDLRDQQRRSSHRGRVVGTRYPRHHARPKDPRPA